MRRSHKACGASRRKASRKNQKPRRWRSRKACGASRRTTRQSPFSRATVSGRRPHKNCRRRKSPEPHTAIVRKSRGGGGRIKPAAQAAGPQDKARFRERRFQAGGRHKNCRRRKSPEQQTAIVRKSRGCGDRIKPAAQAAGQQDTTIQSPFSPATVSGQPVFASNGFRPEADTRIAGGVSRRNRKPQSSGKAADAAIACIHTTAFVSCGSRRRLYAAGAAAASCMHSHHDPHFLRLASQALCGRRGRGFTPPGRGFILV